MLLLILFVMIGGFWEILTIGPAYAFRRNVGFQVVQSMIEWMLKSRALIPYLKMLRNFSKTTDFLLECFLNVFASTLQAG